ncbi:unnamed protein product [Polarella glacialis]|uniref:J domain-containing protein n=1 Tax=Polarella glacialis TaxID=89957 RepID=A0A813FUQ6_POLGL|nr:unnamed protein product [Polarella glacialis]
MVECLSLYQVLGCEQGALFTELRICFKRRALSVHPDKGGSKEAFQQVLAAFETLADPVARASYDRRHTAAVQPATTTRAERTDTEAEGGRGSQKRKRRRTGEERPQASSSSAPAGAANPHEEQQPKQQEPQQPQPQAKQSTSASSRDRPCQKQDDSTPASQTQEPEVEKAPSLAEQAPADQQQQQQQQQVKKAPNLAEQAPADQQQQQQQQQVKKAPSLAEQAPAGQKSQRAAPVSEEFLFEKLRQLLQRLPPAFRKAVIGEIPQNMRRALELWMLDRRTQATRSDPEVSQKLCQRSGDCSENTSEDSSHESSECNGAEADCALALCDATAACRDAAREEVISMSDDSSDMSEQEPEEFLPEVAAEGSWRSGHGRAGVRGIVNVHDTSYAACQRIGILRFSSRVVPDLATALDHLAIITVLKQRAQHVVLDGDNFEDCMRRGLVETKSEVGVEAMEDVGLKFSLTLNKSYWIGHTQVVTPRTACLETALAYRRQFEQLQQALRHRGVVRRGLLNRLSIADLQDNWHRFSALYIEACCGLGEAANFDTSSPKSRQAVAKRLAALVEANSDHRDKQLRAWNCQHMLQEERLQRQAERTERHALLRDARTERHALLRDRRAMSREDRDEARRRKLPSELVKNVVRRWERLQSRLQSQRRRQEAAVLQQELAKQRAAARVEFAKQRAAARVELRRCRTEREEWWRWMNRRDLTMADLLGQRAV